MKFRHFALIAIVMLALAGVAVFRYSTIALEVEAARHAGDALKTEGLDWVALQPDGLHMILEGETDDPAERDRAEQAVLSTGLVASVENRIRVAERAATVPASEGAPYEIRIQKDDSGATLTGYAPSDAARRRLVRLAEIRLAGLAVSDLLKIREGAPKEGWETCVEGAIETLPYLRVGEAAVGAEGVSVRGLAHSVDAREAIDAVLGAALPSGAQKDVSVKAPQPVIAPYPFSASRMDGILRIENCAMPDETTLDVFVSRVEAAFGDETEIACVIGAGAPNPSWDNAAFAGLTALSGLEDGRVDVLDFEAILTGVAESGDALEQARVALSALPENYIGQFRAKIRPPVADPFIFRAETHEGAVRVSGFFPPEEAERLASLETVDLSEASPASGAPSGDWGAAARAAIEALAQLEKGALDAEGARFTLTGEARDATLLEAVRADIATMTPEGYEIDASALRVTPDVIIETAEEAAARLNPFTAKRKAEGLIIISGDAPDAAMREAVKAYAEALFGSENVFGALRVAPVERPQPSWPMAAMAGLDALHRLDSGEVTLLRGVLSVTGEAWNEMDLTALLDEKAPEGIVTKVRIDPLAAPEPVRPEAPGVGTSGGADSGGTDRPSAESDEIIPAELLSVSDCEALMNNVSKRDRILFAADTGEIDEKSHETLVTLAVIAQRCDKGVIEIGGHTDSTGSVESNLRLSKERAETVRSAMVEAGVDPARLVTRGYGEAFPLAGNDTEAGRAENRRIEFAIREAP